VLVPAALLAGGLVVVPAAPASATVYCNISLVYQNAFVPGNDDNGLTPNCISAQGAVNNAVVEIQRALVTCYHKNIAVDRDFGPRTKAALVQVQQSLGIANDGVYGPQTARAMTHPVVGGGGACTHITF
jgi:peptidoglycan hydrolase-like protein with peptidoglycan-binding domain